MQGQLRNEKLEAELITECGHCGTSLALSITSRPEVLVRTGGVDPLVFMPDVNWASFTEPNILDAY